MPDADDEQRREHGPYDHVVVGAGSAGAVVAARLSEDPDRRVLLLEAGPDDASTAVTVPAAFSQLFKSERDWAYETTPQRELHGRTVFWPRGRMLGGSSSMNAMMWVRGFAADYDEWAEHAGAAWSWESLLPYFLRVEGTLGPVDGLHGADGPVPVEPQRSPRSHTDRFLTAARQAGHVVEAANLERPQGFTRTMVTQHRGARVSTARAYLAPALGRANLEVRTGAHVARVVVEDGVAVGVELLTDDGPLLVRSRRDVVLCAGTVGTPQLLMLSGIGPADELRAHGIDVVVDAAQVGRGLRDHLVAGHVVRVGGDTLLSATKAHWLADYLVRRRGMLTSNVAEAYGFVRSDPALELPDLEIIFAPVAYVGEGLVPPPEHGLTVGPILLRPRSRGTVTLRSADPRAKAVVDPAYLQDPADLAVLLRGMRIAADLIAAPALREVTDGSSVLPGLDALGPDERHEEIVRAYAHTLYHPTSTARMGSDGAAVVDPELRVRGVRGLRVADASVMPEIVRGHTHAPTVVIGERAADLLRATSA